MAYERGAAESGTRADPRRQHKPLTAEHRRARLTRACRSTSPDSTALVTGSTQGIGLAIAARLAEAGARVVVNGRRGPRRERGRRALEGDVVGVAADVTTDDGVATLLDAGARRRRAREQPRHLRRQPALEITDDDWRRFFEVNVLSAARLIRTYLPGMRRGRLGPLLNIASDWRWRSRPR